MDQPDLRIGKALPQPGHCLHLILIQFIFARLNVDGDELVLVRCRQIGANFALDERVAAPGEFLFAMAAFGGSHPFPPGTEPWSNSSSPHHYTPLGPSSPT